jgi:hypothetical protein
MTAKILSGVLARASDKRAMNREERAKDSYGTAFEIANAQDRGLNAMPGELGVDQSGNLDLLPTTALQTTDGVTNRQPYVFDDSPVDTSYNFAPNNEEMATRERIANQRAEAFANASPEAPLGVPYARQDVALTVGEPTGEDTTRIGRYLSGTLEQDVLPTNANKALSQALRGANVPEFQFDEYRQNKRAINQPKYGEPFMLYGNDNSSKMVQKVQTANGMPKIIDMQGKGVDVSGQSGIQYSLDKQQIQTSNPYKVEMNNGLTRTLSGQIVDGVQYISWNGKMTPVGEIPNIKNVEPTSLQKPSTTKIINQGDTSQTEYEKIMGKQTAEKYIEYEETSYIAQEALNSIDISLQMFAAQDTAQGITAPLKTLGVRLLKAIGITKDDKGNPLNVDSNTQFILSRINEATLASVKRLTGPISEKELVFLKTLQADLGNTPQANAAILLYQKFLAKKAAGFNDYVYENGGRPGNEKDSSALMRQYKQSQINKYGTESKGFLKFVSSEANIELQKVQEQFNDGLITQNELDEKSLFITVNKYQIPYLQGQLGN